MGKASVHARTAHVVDGLLAAGVCAVAAAIYLSHYGVGNALSSDNVMPYVMFDDVFRRHVGLAGFYWPESPFYFPDTALAWLLYALTGSLLSAVTAYALVNSLLLVLLVRLVLRRAAGADAEGARAAWLLFLGIWFAIGLAGVRSGTSWFGQFYACVFVPNNHSGALLALLAGLAILVGDQSRAGSRSLVLLLALCVVTLLSDRLFEIQFVLPAIACCAIAFRQTRVRWYAHAALLLGVLLAGAEVLRWLNPSDTMKWVTGLAGSEAGFQVGGDPTMRVGAGKALQQLLADMREIMSADPLTTAIELAALAASGFVLVHWRKSAAALPASRRWLLVVFIAAAVAAPLIATVGLGRHIAMHALRYCETTTLLLVPLAMLAAGMLPAERSILHRLAAGIAALAVASLFVVDASLAALRNNDRDQEQCLRELAAHHQLGFGVAEFWHALSMTARFRDTPVTAPLSADAGPRMSMVTNIGWFGAVAEDANGLPALRFVDEYSYAPDLLDTVFGKSSERANCPRSAYRLYGASDGALAHMYRHFEWLPGQIVDRLGRATLPAAAWAADERYIDGDAIRGVGPLAPSTPLLITAQDFPRGRLHAWMSYSLQPHRGSVRWNVSSLDSSGNTVVALGEGTLPATDGIARIDLALGPRDDATPGVGISVVASGDVDVRLLAIGLRIRDR